MVEMTRKERDEYLEDRRAKAEHFNACDPEASHQNIVAEAQPKNLYSTIKGIKRKPQMWVTYQSKMVSRLSAVSVFCG